MGRGNGNKRLGDENPGLGHGKSEKCTLTTQFLNRGQDHQD